MRRLLLLCLCAVALASEAHTPWFASIPKVEAGSGHLPSSIRVGLLATHSTVSIGCTGDYTYVPLRGRHAKPVSVSKAKVLKVRVTSHGMLIGQTPVTGSVLVSPTRPDGLIRVDGRSYRGELVLTPRGQGALQVINQVDLEDYLCGVLPREVGADWPPEALKAQAVVSRTFVAANIGKYGSKGYDLTSDVLSQAYGGQGGEQPATTLAVKATAGDILVDKQRAPVQAYFHSSCGGYTENPVYVWRTSTNPHDYLTSIRDGYCQEDPYYHWQFRISADLLRRRLRKAGFAVGKVREISIASRAPSGRASVMAVGSTGGSLKLPANNFRMALGPDNLRSVFLTGIEHQKGLFIFEGRGWGHGVGLCQWGARGRALAGHSYEKILKAYFPHTTLAQWDYSE